MKARLHRIAPMAVFLLSVCASPAVWAGPYAPPAGQAGSTAIDQASPLIINWATGFQDLMRGPHNIVNSSPLASFGTGNNALGPATSSTSNVVSLGDGGRITLTFSAPITDGPGPDLAVFENSFSDQFLELAFVEVSTNGSDFVRFPAMSLTPTVSQIGSFDPLDATDLNNLAGKYRGGFGTPFDLSEVRGLSPLVDVDHIFYVRIVDVIGTIDPTYATRDAAGNIINDPYPTAFASGGFDLDAVGVLHQTPEPGTLALCLCGVIGLLGWRRWQGHGQASTARRT
ncbi:MAG: hypothetical protein AB7N91_19400 [Candidatus Tectimicrobiota bacterium]